MTVLSRNNKRSLYRAFTYVEMLVVLGLFSSITLLLVPVSLSQISRQRINSESEDLSSQIFSMQQNSFTHKSGGNYGIKFFSDRYELFQGLTYSTGTVFETIDYKNGVTASSINLTEVVGSAATTEVVFPAGEIEPTAIGDITLSTADTDYSIIINLEGLIYYAKL